MKKILILLCSVCLVFSPIQVDAKNSNDESLTIQISEFDIYKEVKSLSDEELLKKGVSSDEILKIRNLNLVDVIRERAELSDEQLSDLGYTENDIITLRNFVKKRNITEDEAISTLSSATLTLTLTAVSTSVREFQYHFIFQWSSAPYFLQQDIIGVIWSACTSSGAATTMAINKNSSYMNVKYKINGVSQTSTQAIEWYPENEYSSVTATFDVGSNMGSNALWAYYGSGYIELEAVGSADVYEVYLKIGYGHTVLAGVPSVEFTGSGPSISMNFNWTTNEEDFISVRYRYNGTKVSW